VCYVSDYRDSFLPSTDPLRAIRLAVRPVRRVAGSGFDVRQPACAGAARAICTRVTTEPDAHARRTSRRGRGSGTANVFIRMQPASAAPPGPHARREVPRHRRGPRCWSACGPASRTGVLDQAPPSFPTSPHPSLHRLKPKSAIPHVVRPRRASGARSRLGLRRSGNAKDSQRLGAAALALVAGAAWPLRAQMHMQTPHGDARGPSAFLRRGWDPGTSWLPDASPMHAAHYMFGRWTLMLHGKGFCPVRLAGRFPRQQPAGNRQLGRWQLRAGQWAAVNSRLRAMLSAERGPSAAGATAGWSIGRVLTGRAAHDRQHPHDLFMELAALYERPVARNLGLSLYLRVRRRAGGGARWPFPHRPSARTIRWRRSPIIGRTHPHHLWGRDRRGVHAEPKLEASWFNAGSRTRIGRTSTTRAAGSIPTAPV